MLQWVVLEDCGFFTTLEHLKEHLNEHLSDKIQVQLILPWNR